MVYFTKSFEIIQKVYGESAIYRTTVFHWYSVYLEGRESILDEQTSRRPMTTRTRENIAPIADILKENLQSSCRLIAGWMGIPKTIVQQILRKDLQKWKLSTQFVPHTLMAKQKEQYLNHSFDLIETIKSDPNFLDSIIMGDECWCFVYDPETKCPSFWPKKEWHS